MSEIKSLKTLDFFTSSVRKSVFVQIQTNTLFHISLLHDSKKKIYIWLVTLKLLTYVVTKLNHMDNNGGNA